jgi:Holliday junction DNA helicase RuvB
VTDEREDVFAREGSDEDRALERSLRPVCFEEFPGQNQVKRNLGVYIQAARGRGEALDHILLSGPPGLGKTTLAHIVAREIGVGFKATSGPALEKARDLAGVLTSLNERDVLFIDEIHRLGIVVEEYLYAAMEDFVLDIVIDQGPAARSIRLNLKPFTLIGSTTREGLLSAPFRARFGVREKLDLYPWEDLLTIVHRSAGILDATIADDAAELIARRSRGTPRIANRFLRRVRDLAEVGAKTITRAVAEEGLAMLGVDAHGLQAMDRRVLGAICRHGGGPVGLKTIAVMVGEAEDTIEEVYEPYLIQQGFLQKGPRGRSVTPDAWKVLGLEPGQATAQGDLFS